MVAGTQLGSLVLMGSGETTPTMVTTHKALLDTTRRRTGHDQLAAALLNTPYGFQQNASEITARTQHYFHHHVGQAVAVVDAAKVEGAPAVDVERQLDAVRHSDWLFAGPGSPTYALRQWRAAAFADAMADVHRRGGTLVFASAAAVTAGSHAVPVYEIYKVGETPGWVEGLGLVGRVTGWPCVVIPHFDNAEGQTHDTRFCYLGESRLSAMEEALPDEVWILGVDEHTACVIDGTDGAVSVRGRGGVYVRHRGSVTFALGDGETAPMVELAAAARRGSPSPLEGSGPQTVTPPAGRAEPRGDPFLEQLQVLAARFDAAVRGEGGTQDVPAAVAATLDTQRLIDDWSADSLTSDASDRAVAVLRGMITRLGDLAEAGVHNHADLVRPHIETLLHVRDEARARQAYDIADHIRGHMDADGVRVKDTRDGSVWEWDEPA